MIVEQVFYFPDMPNHNPFSTVDLLDSLSIKIEGSEDFITAGVVEINSGAQNIYVCDENLGI